MGANHGGLGGAECVVTYGVCIYNRYGLGLRALGFRFQRVRQASPSISRLNNNKRNNKRKEKNTKSKSKPKSTKHMTWTFGKSHF